MGGAGAALQVDEAGQEVVAEGAAKPGSALYRVTEPVRGRLAAALATAALGAVAGVVGFVGIALALRELFAADVDTARVVALLVLAAVGFLVRFALRAWSFLLSHLASFDLEQRLRTDLAAHLGRVPLGRRSAWDRGR